MHRRDKSNSETATHICISLRLSLLYAYVCARKRVCVCARSSASLSACACVSARIGAPVFVCMRVSIHVRSHPRFPLISRLSSRADVEGDVKMKSHSLAHTHTGAKNSLKLEGGKHIPRTRQSPAPPATGPLSLSRNISASSLTAKHHRDATEAERSPNRTTPLPQPLLPH